MANFDSNVTINVTGDAPAVPSASFSSILLIAAANTLGVGFTERTRAYTTAAAVAADLAAGDINTATAAKLNAWLAQNPRVGRVLVGRADLQAQVISITITTAADGLWEIALTPPSGTEVTRSYTASGSATASAIATGLRAAFALGGAVAGVTVGGSGAEILLFTAEGDNDITAVAVDAPAGGAATVAEDQAGTSLASELDAILATTTAFYGVAQETVNSHVLNLRLAEWCRTNQRLGLIQTSDSGVIAGTSTDIAAVLKAAGDDRNAVTYHGTSGNAEAPAFLVGCKKLAANPDRVSTAWAYAQLVGPTVQALTETQKTHLIGKNANVYGSFAGAGSFQPGKLPNGDWIDKRVTFDWLTARCREAVQQLIINVSNRNAKLGMDDAGIQAVASVVAAVLKQGESAGHFTPGSTSVTAPAAADLTLAEKQSGALELAAQGELRVGIYSVTVGVTLVLDIASLAAAA